MPNPYQKYLTKENKLQHSVITYINFQYPDLLYTHVANEGKRSRWEQYLIKYLGVKAGVPDLLIFDPKGKYNGLAIEFKIKYNKPTENQERWLNELKMRNWACFIIYNYDDAVELINKYYHNDL